MHKRALLLFAFLLIAIALPSFAQQRAQTQAPASPVVVFWEDAFPVADTAAPSRAVLTSLLPEAAFTNAQQLSDALAREETRLLVMPFGSAFPEDQWRAIYAFLERGGNLLVVGGRPFTRPAYFADNAWKLRSARPVFAKQLFINEYQVTPGSQGQDFRVNEDFSFLDLPSFEWKQAYSMTIRLSDEDLYPRGGSTGGIDARLNALAWGVQDGRRMSAPLVQIDHLKNHFVGGRWIFLSCDLPAEFFTSAAGKALVPKLAGRALDAAEEFTVRPSWALFLPGEPLTFQLHWSRSFGPLVVKPAPVRLELDITSEIGPVQQQSYEFSPAAFPFSTQITLPAPSGTGLHTVIARLYAGTPADSSANAGTSADSSTKAGLPAEVRQSSGRTKADRALRAIFRTGFWLRDSERLRSGPHVTVNENFFEVEGKPLLVVGTTYMASDVQRQFFMSPNPCVWDRDMAELRAAGINMLRTGWWTAWDQVMKESGVLHEEELRALEAYLLTARKYELPVQFTFFAFIPEVLGGANAYLDPEAVRRQKELIVAVVARFKDVPFLMWDLINEPSFANPNKLWQTRPNRDPHELRAWNAWLKSRYPSPAPDGAGLNRAALAEAWKTVAIPEGQPVPLPADDDFGPRRVYQATRGGNSLKVYDYFLFAQESFRKWVEEMRDAIRGTGSRQLVTVGQDEAGGRAGLNPSFWGEAVDFTTNHSWWLFDALLWDSLVAKQPGKAALIQETGIGRDLQIDESTRRTPEQQAQLLERKLAIALATGAGTIHWLWNINAYMRDDNEAHIGAVRADRTEKPEADVLRKFAAFAAEARDAMSQPQSPEVAIVTSQALQFSALNNMALDAQTKAVRALHYYCQVPGYVIAENQVARMGKPKLAILPSPQALSEEAWQALLNYVAAGGNLLITGSMERDPHWQITHRLAALGLEASPEPLLSRSTELHVDSTTIPLSFDADRQQYAEALRMPSGETFRELAWGKGKIIVTSYPVELADGLDATAEVYSRVLHKVGVEPLFEALPARSSSNEKLAGKLPSPGVLIRPVRFAAHTLYLFVSESATDQEISIRDTTTGAEMRFTLPSMRSRLVLIRNSDGKIVARYGF